MRQIILGLAVWSAAGSAVVLQPPPADIAAAAHAGAVLAVPHEGYRLKDYAIYAVRESRTIDPADGEVDAVVLRTPLERTRHAAFVAAYSGKDISPAGARAGAGIDDGEVEFAVYAHGATASDQDFAEGFSHARLEIAGRTLEAAPVAGEPSVGSYPLLGADRNRFVTVIRYAFRLSDIAAKDIGQARLSFTDGGGKSFDLPFDFAAFR